MSDVFPAIYRYNYTMYICLPRMPDVPTVWDSFMPTCFSLNRYVCIYTKSGAFLSQFIFYRLCM